MKVIKQVVLSDPEVVMGKPVMAGTRVTVESILERLSAGETVEQIADAHPYVSVEEVRTALAFASS